MLERKYDPNLPYSYARYGRMSDPNRQNPRSPDQQFATIDETLQRLDYSWQLIRTYRDDGISGRKLRSRKGLQAMLRDIEAGLVKVDLIVVDTYERLGRADEIAMLRHKLFTDYGVLVVAADNNFADPTGVVGKAVGMVEQIRATENTRISRHNVIRGKKDTARLRRWPGGEAPFGFVLKAIVDSSGSATTKVYNVLEVETRGSAAMKLAFRRAADTGYGDTRMARWWNTSPEIPQDFKPISPTTMGYRLENPIYMGTLRWGDKRTGIVNDTRVTERNPREEVTFVADFCTPLVDPELFERVQELRELRSLAIRKARQKAKDDVGKKLIAPQGRGLTLKYPLTGLVRCGCCHASMRPLPSGRQSKGGRRYVYYTCPRHLDGSCPNSHNVPIEDLCDAVFSRLRARLFPPPDLAGQVPGWFSEVLELLRRELIRQQEEEPDPHVTIAKEVEEIGNQLAGWGMTLGDPKLPEIVRQQIVKNYEAAALRKQTLEQEVESKRALRQHLDQLLDPKEVISHLQNLGEVLSGYNPTLVNLELSKHIDRILCHPDGTIEMRGTMLGLFEGAIFLLSRTAPVPNGDQGTLLPQVMTSVTPRRRGRLHLPNLSAESTAALKTMDTALDPERFADIPEAFFWTETWVLTRKVWWFEENAAEVARLRRAKLTIADIAKRLGKTIPTIRKALRFAEKADPGLQDLPRKMSRSRWAEDHAAEVASLKAQGKSVPEIATFFEKSDTTIRAALRYADKLPRVA